MLVGYVGLEQFYNVIEILPDLEKNSDYGLEM